ncbi:hypothetical protein Ancab_013992 [Ancistrocladus abbreviatus]
MGMAIGYSPPKPEEDMIKVIHNAVDSGISSLIPLILMTDLPFTNETPISKASCRQLMYLALKGGMTEEVLLATNSGIKFVDVKTNDVCGDPACVRATCEEA